MSEQREPFWYPRAPAVRLAVLRIAVGSFALVYLLIRCLNFASVAGFHAGEFRPVGIVNALAAPLSAAAVYTTIALAILTGVLFLVGVRFRWLSPVFAAALLWVTSYRSSWGMIFHTDNLLVLHVAILAMTPASDALSWDARRSPAPEPHEHGRYGWGIRLMVVITACTYVVAGVAKLKLAGSEWLGGDMLRHQIAFDNLRKIELGSGFSSLGVWLVRHPAIFTPLAIVTLLLELGAPLVLLGRRVALVWCVAAWAFHVGIALLMHIGFPYPLSFVAYLPAFRVEAVLQLKLFRRFFPALPNANA